SVGRGVGTGPADTDVAAGGPEMELGLRSVVADGAVRQGQLGGRATADRRGVDEQPGALAHEHRDVPRDRAGAHRAADALLDLHGAGAAVGPYVAGGGGDADVAGPGLPLHVAVHRAGRDVAADALDSQVAVDVAEADVAGRVLAVDLCQGQPGGDVQRRAGHP